MSVIRPILNQWLRLTERPHLAKSPPEKLRSSFETKAKLFFHGPNCTRYRRDTIAGVPVQWVVGAGASTDKTILYLHGGGYVFGSSDTHRAMAARLSWLSGWQVCLPDYRLAPEHPFPAAYDDAMAVLDAISPNGPLVLGGDSAGGGLALSLHAARAGDKNAPVGCFAFSPLTDLTFSGESITENADSDVVLPAKRIPEMAAAYLSGADPEDPRASPLRADFKGANPVWLTVGDTEILFDDTRRMADTLTKANVDATVIVTNDLPHVWPIFQGLLPEAMSTLKTLAHWINS